MQSTQSNGEPTDGQARTHRTTQDEVTARREKDILRAMLATGWHFSTLNVRGVVASAGRPTDGTVITVHEEPSNWAQVPDDTSGHALLLDADMTDEVTVLAEGLSELNALRRWKQYMHDHPGPELEKAPDGRKTRRRKHPNQ